MSPVLGLHIGKSDSFNAQDIRAKQQLLFQVLFRNSPEFLRRSETFPPTDLLRWASIF
jgi:hypothetical protein